MGALPSRKASYAQMPAEKFQYGSGGYGVNSAIRVNVFRAPVTTIRT
jgi:hypothetical protein